jgi:hypothetical protein
MMRTALNEYVEQHGWLLLYILMVLLVSITTDSSRHLW